MNWLNHQADSQELAWGTLLSGLVGDAVLVPMLITAALAHGPNVHWSYLWGAAGLAVLSASYLVVTALRRPRRRRLAIEPRVGVAVAAAGLVAASLTDIGADLGTGLYLPILLVGVLFVSLIGDRAMRGGVAALACALTAWTALAEHVHGGRLLSTLVVYDTVIVTMAWLAGWSMRTFHTLTESREGMRILAETIAGADNLDTGLTLGLPKIPSVLATDHVAVFVRNEADRGNLLLAWPKAEPDDAHIPAMLPFAESCRGKKVVLWGSMCFLPIGYAERGELVMVLRHRRRAGETTLAIREAAEYLATTFLRLTSRTAFVAGLQRETRTDPLTGLANRRALLEGIDGELARAQRTHQPLSVAMIDLDHFKQYNDTFGHVAGDVLLRAVAAVMAANVRRQDLVARYGGEEFCIVLPQTDRWGAAQLLEKLRSLVASSQGTDAVTVSVGIADWTGDESPEQLIERADAALYAAKEGGRDRVVTVPAAYSAA